MSGLVLAVDGGNTKTVAVVADAGRRVLGMGRGGQSDIYGCKSPELAVDEIVRVAEAALAQAGVSIGDIGPAVFSLAGADWPEDIAYLEAELGRRLAPARVRVINDSMGALRSGSPHWEGVVVAVGTHNAVGARRRDGRMFHLGFWPDLAGGFELGSQALKATYRAGLGLAPETALSGRVLEMFGQPDAMALLHAFTRREKRLPLIEARKLASVVLDVADAGDVTAIGIVERMGAALGDQGRVSAGKVELPLEGATVVLTGGVMQHPSKRLAGAIMARMPGASAVRPQTPPVAGALMIALDELGVVADQEELTDGLALAEARG